MTTHTHVHHHHHRHPLAVHHIDAHTMEELAIIHECLHKLHVHRSKHPNATDNSGHVHIDTDVVRVGSGPANAAPVHPHVPAGTPVHQHAPATSYVIDTRSGIAPHVTAPAAVHTPAAEEDVFEAMQKAAMAPANVTHNPHLKADGTHYTAEEVVTFQKELFKSGKLSAPKAREIWAKVGASAKTAPTPEQCGQLMYDLRQVH